MSDVDDALRTILDEDATDDCATFEIVTGSETFGIQFATGTNYDRPVWNCSCAGTAVADVPPDLEILDEGSDYAVVASEAEFPRGAGEELDQIAAFNGDVVRIEFVESYRIQPRLPMFARRLAVSINKKIAGVMGR